MAVALCALILPLKKVSRLGPVTDSMSPCILVRFNVKIRLTEDGYSRRPAPFRDRVTREHLLLSAAEYRNHKNTRNIHLQVYAPAISNDRSVKYHLASAPDMIGHLTIARRGYRQLWVPCICSAVTRFLPNDPSVLRIHLSLTLLFDTSCCLRRSGIFGTVWRTEQPTLRPPFQPCRMIFCRKCPRN